MGTDTRLEVVTDDAEAGAETLMRAVEDLAATERALSRFREDSDLSRLNRSGVAEPPGERLSTAIEKAIDAYEWSDGLLDPRVIDPLERFGYQRRVPLGNIGAVEPPEALVPTDMRGWIEGPGKVSLPPGVRLDLAGVGKALGIGWAAMHLAGHAGLLVDVGGDVVALGTHVQGDPWTVLVIHDEAVGQFSGSSLAIATSTTTKRAWTAGGEEMHHLIDPRTGAPSQGELSYATVAAPSIIEADLAAKLLIIEGRAAVERFDERYRAVLTDRRGRTEVLA
jgi:thiamine biosynthesis lipoprotein